MGMGVGSEVGSSASSPSSSSSSSSSSSNLRPTPNPTPSSSHPPPNPSQAYRTEIARLMAHPALFTPHFTPPKNVIVLCHGLYGFSTATPIPLFPSLKLHYWHSVLSVLRETLGCKVMVVGVKGTGSIEERAGEMDRWLKDKLPRGTGVNFVAHSMVSQPVPAMEWSSRRIKWLSKSGVLWNVFLRWECASRREDWIVVTLSRI